MDLTEAYRKLNDIELVSITMISDQGGQVNLAGICKHISIYEEVGYPFLSAEIKIIDARSIASHMPITGHEVVNIQYRTPGIGSKVVDINLEVVSMSGREKAKGDRSEIYTLQLKSKNLRLDSSKKVYGPYEGRISEMVKEIMDRYLVTSKGDLIQKTLGTHKFVIPAMKPVEAIKWLSTRCTSAEPPHNADFHFYETVDGTNFVSLGSIAQAKPYRSYHTRPSSLDRRLDSVIEDFLRIQEVKISKDFNRELDLLSGGIAGNMVTHDITYKELKYSRFNHVQDFDESDHIEDFRSMPTNSKYLASLEGPYYFAPKQNMNFGEGFDNNYNQEDYLLKSLSTRSMWNHNKINITVAGDSTLRAGHVVEVTFPSNEPKDKNDPNWYSKYESGKYLISAIRHVIFNESPFDYTCMLELCRDSSPKAIPTESKFLGTSKNFKDNSESVFA